MDALPKVLNRFQYTQKNWTYAKVLTIIVWLAFVLQELAGHHTAPTPVGICQCLNCNAIISAPYSYLIAGAAIILSLLYIWEKYMPITLCLLAITGMIVFSVAISDGSRPRFEILSMVLIVQLIAYVQYRLSGAKFKAATSARNVAMFYSIQIIASCYMISAIRKVQVSGLSWIVNAPNVAIKVIASFTARGLDFNMHGLIPLGQGIAGFVINHPLLIQFGFAGTFVIEFFALIATIGRKQARYYGFLLLLMHFFILLVMGIVIIPFVMLLVAYIINLPDKSPVPANRNAGVANGIGPVLFRLGLPVIFIGLTFIIGEQHPFSRFPMFSTMDNFARYYWLQDQNGRAVSSRTCFGVRGDQFKNLIGDRAIIQHVNLRDSDALRPICAPLIQSLATSHLSNLKAQNISEIKLMDHWLWIDSGHICQRDIVLADVRADTTGR